MRTDTMTVDAGEAAETTAPASDTALTYVARALAALGAIAMVVGLITAATTLVTG